MAINSINYENLNQQNKFKCKFCKICNGYGCIGELPGMGGVDNNYNFILNCKDWTQIYNSLSLQDKQKVDRIEIYAQEIGLAPVTGAQQNIGFKNEQDFYLPYLKNGLNKGHFLCVGDGAPDEKLKLGLAAVESLGVKATFILKPYSQNILKERINLVLNSASAIGIDIDAYNIVTMRNQVHLEKKNVQNLKEIRKWSKLPLVVKGIFTQEDIDLCSELKPEIIVVSNHGGRIQTQKGSSAEFLKNNATKLKKYCKELWVDGGIRSEQDKKVAKFLGADKILIGRPFIQEILK